MFESLNKRIPVVIPSYEPDNSLIQLCDNLSKQHCNNVIIIDDGSGSDYSHFFDEAEKKYGFVVLHHDVNKGKGRALKTAFSYMLEHKNDNAEDPIIGCITADSDGQHSLDDIFKCAKSLDENRNSLILGCRNFDGDNVPGKSKFGNKLTQKIFGFLCGLKISDTQTGLRGIPTDFMEYLLNVPGERFEFETHMLIETKNRLNIIEVPIETIYDSKTDHKTHFNPFLDSIKIYWIFVKIFFRYIISSLSSCVIDLIFFTIFCGLMINSFPVLYVLFATIFARIISSLYNCIVNFFFVFKSHKTKGNLKKSILKYYILVIIQMFISAGVVTLITCFTHAFVSDTLIKFIVDMIIFFVNYYFQRKFIF